MTRPRLSVLVIVLFTMLLDTTKSGLYFQVAIIIPSSNKITRPISNPNGMYSKKPDFNSEKLTLIIMTTNKKSTATAPT